MIIELKENIPHGTKEYPYDQYFIRNVRHPFQFPVHWHDELEIIYIRQGILHVSIEGQDYAGHSGSIFIVNPRELHFMGSDDLSVAYFTLLFPLEFISFQTMDGLESDLLMPLRSGQLQFPREISDPVLLKELCDILENIVLLNQEASSLHCQIETRLFLLKILNLMEKHHLLLTSSLPGSQINLQREMLSYIQEHFTEKLSLKELSFKFHLSEKYISRYFKEHFKLTFSDYVNHLRLTCAKRLLETTKLPVTEVALCAGFPNVSHFIRMFKRQYGSSPLKYRKSF